MQFSDLPVLKINKLLNTYMSFRDEPKILTEVQAEIDAYDLAHQLTNSTPDIENLLKDIERW
jgi:hypothetical protein